MRKNDLIEQNAQLFDRLYTAETLVKELKKQLSEQSEIIKEQDETIKQLETRLENAPTPLKQLEERVIKQTKYDPMLDYGASVIGKAVVEAARYCARLDDGENKKELVNLILGRTEVLKAEILKAVYSKNDTDGKKNLIDTEFDSALDYFNSAISQNI